MKMDSCAAQLMNCDVLMLDEPSGHLDMVNVRWVEDWKLKTFKGVKGNIITVFVEKYPELKAHFELCNGTIEFAFPEPGPLEGVKSRSKAWSVSNCPLWASLEGRRCSDLLRGCRHESLVLP